MDLQASWDYVRKGRRYETSSFIYAMSSVCTFCAQLFCKEDEVASSKGLPQPISPIKTAASGECEITTGNIESDDCNMITTEIKRKDVAFGQRAYQSSTVDNMSADIALSSRPSSEWDVFTVKGGSKTRREVDSWWEVDLGRTTHIDSISVVVCAAIQQPLSVYVILLNEPVGFENPFLDKITGKAVKFKQFDLAPAASPKFEKIDWKLPEMTVCVSIRVQLRGIHALCINRFQAFQGNELMEATETDLLRTANSFASLSPNAMNEGFLDIRRSLGSPKGTSGFGKTRPGTGAAGLTRMMSSSLDLLNTSSLAVGAKTKNPKISEVTKLSKQISDQYAAINAWKTRALHSVEYFTREEIFALRDVIFNVILQDMGVQGIPEPVLLNQSAVSNALTVGSGNVESGGSALASNSLAEENEHVVNYGISDGDIVDAGLVAYAPRVPFLELSKRLRQIFRWIQGREHPKLLGPLLYSERFVAITLDPTDTLYKFNKCVQSIEKSHSSDSFIGTNANVSPGGSAGANATVGKDCSWSQFLMIMHLLCAGKSSKLCNSLMHVYKNSLMKYLSVLFGTYLQCISTSGCFLEILFPWEILDLMPWRWRTTLFCSQESLLWLYITP